MNHRVPIALATGPGNLRRRWLSEAVEWPRRCSTLGRAPTVRQGPPC